MKKQALLSLAVTASLVTVANAHNLWIVPSQTQLSGKAAWVTFDAAASNQLFIANHASLDLANIQAWSPSNKIVEKQHGIKGKVRTTFDLQLQAPGTYQVLRSGVNIFARGKRPEGEPPKGEQPPKAENKHTENHGNPPKGQPPKRRGWRGSINDYLQGKYPENLSEEHFITSVSQVETFVTLGAPTETVTAPSLYGLDIDYLTHPNDLVIGEVVKLRVMIDGKPAAGIEVEIIEGNSQYRNEVGALKLTSNADGEISAIWQKAGMYWLHVQSEDDKGLTTNKKRRLSYSAVLEVLPD